LALSLRRRSATLALALAGVVAALATSELVLRGLARRSPVQGLRDLHEARPDRPWLYGLRPGARGTLPESDDVSYVVNATGFRDRLYERPKPPGVFRILVLGDSLSFGYGVAQEESFPKRMEASLPAKVEVLNFGVGGYNPYNEAMLLADIGASYQPDLVLVQFCINDLNDPTLHFDAQTRLHLHTIPDAAYPDPRDRQSSLPLPGWALPACRRLRLCSLLDDAWLAWRGTRPHAAQLRETFAPAQDLLPGPKREWLRSWYGNMARRAGSMGARFAVVVFPYREQVEGNAPSRIQDALAALGRAGGWKTIDLLPSFRAAAAGESQPLFLDAWHPSPSGHRIAGEAILAALVDEGGLHLRDASG
jgi:lysophospholipase L1-like esterase